MVRNAKKITLKVLRLLIGATQIVIFSESRLFNAIAAKFLERRSKTITLAINTQPDEELLAIWDLFFWSHVLYKWSEQVIAIYFLTPPDQNVEIFRWINAWDYSNVVRRFKIYKIQAVTKRFQTYLWNKFRFNLIKSVFQFYYLSAKFIFRLFFSENALGSIILRYY